MSTKHHLRQTLEQLKAAFPDAVVETTRKGKGKQREAGYAVTPEFIRLLQKGEVDDSGDNRYELRFPGKQAARAAVFAPCYKTLLPDEKQSENFHSTGNVFIEGDNLDALKLLQNSYRGRVNVIYIDPPYNTGGDGFVYNDSFSVSQKAYLRAAGVLDDDGVRQISGAQNKLRGRFHAKWLAFIYPRLKLARELLADDGVIFVSIDQNEQANLKLVCDEIFGENNCLATITWQGMDTIKNDARYFSSNSEFVLCYAKRMDTVEILGIPKTEKQRKTYKNHDNDPRGDYLLTPLHAKSGKPSNVYTYTFPNGQTWRPPEGRYPRFSKETLDKLVRNGEIYLDPKGKKVPQRKTYWDSKNGHMPPTTFWDYEQFGSTRQSNAELRKLLGRGVFDNPKPVQLIRTITGIIPRKDSLVLDFFAGSATTAHAVMELNAEDGGTRKFILVQLPEPIDKKKSAEAHKFCKEQKRPANIAEIAKARIRLAGNKIRQKSLWQGDTGFKVFSVKPSLLHAGASDALIAKDKRNALAKFTTNLKPENFDAVLYETLLHTGAMLDQPLTTGKAGKYPFAICNRNCYCVTEKLTQDIAREIVEKHGGKFDMLYYLSDALESTTSYTQIEAAVNLANKQAQMLAFY